MTIKEFNEVVNMYERLQKIEKYLKQIQKMKSEIHSKGMQSEKITFSVPVGGPGNKGGLFAYANTHYNDIDSDTFLAALSIIEYDLEHTKMLNYKIIEEDL